MKIKYFTIIITLLLTSCNKFLDVAPKGIVIPTKLADYEGLLYSNAITTGFSPEMLHITDDLYFLTQTATNTTQANAYLWHEYIDADLQAAPAIWSQMYSAIYHANVIIKGVFTATDGTDAQKRQLYSEALLVRSYCYLDLLTVFARAYDPATADSDPGLPMVTSTDVAEKAPARSSVKVVVDALTADLTTAAEGLPATNINKYRATRHAAFAVLSRIALYKADFAAAKTYAEQALAAPHAMIDYNNYTVETIPNESVSPETLLMRSATNSSPQVVLYSEELINLYDNRPTVDYTTSPDLRFRYFTTSTAAGLQRVPIDQFGASWSSFGIRFTEMDLTVAEVMARGNNLGGAMAIVNALRRNRIATNSYAEQTAASAEDALTRVLEERRRELALGGLRWFDMKRLDREGRMPELLRVNRALGTTPRQQIASLPPHSPRYTFQIPARVLQFNSSITKN